MRKFAFIARTYDKNFGHFTTRQNIQYNWIKLEQVPDILQHLADVEVTGIQSSGNCVRNITADQYAGRAKDELADPRVYCELLRQYSFLHPEFSYLPRKFKIAVTGSPNDRAAVAVHDIGLRMHKNEQGEIGFEVLVGGGSAARPTSARRSASGSRRSTFCRTSKPSCASTTCTAGATTSTRRASRSS
jgi:sulfite reductase (NADPH) hemoprotein beta-component